MVKVVNLPRFRRARMDERTWAKPKSSVGADAPPAGLALIART